MKKILTEVENLRRLASMIAEGNMSEGRSDVFKKGDWVKVTTGGFGSPGPVVSVDDGEIGVRLDGEVHYFEPEELAPHESGLSMTSGPDSRNFKNKPDHVTRRSGR